jgi:hypothetical protein
LPKLYAWQDESLATFRGKFAAASNCGAIDTIDKMKAALRLSLNNAQGLLHRLPIKADATDREALETWVRRLREALGDK